MLGRDHATSAGLAFAALAPLVHASGWTLAAGIAVTAGAGLLPDADHCHTTVALTYGFLTEGFAWVVEHISGGHRHGTHSLLGIAVFTAIAWGATWRHSVPALVLLGVLLALLLSAAFRALRIGGHHGDLIGIAGAVAMIHWHVGLSLVPVCMAIGAAAHIAGDMLTHSGCPLAWPVSMREFHLLPGPMRFTTGKFAEHWIVGPVLVLSLVGTLLWDLR